jgi:CheY-like chemotaxis protein
VEGVLDLLAPQFVERRLDLLYEIADGVPGMVRGDATRLRQILVNLLGNAAKFTEKGEAVLSVRSRILDLGPCELTFTVRDTGIGIPQEAIGRLFRSFSQVDTSTTRRFGGSGLGLAISRRLAELMGGAMWVESEEGKGSVFGFTVLVEAVLSKPRPFLGTGAGQLAGKRLLVVDDNATNRRNLTSFASGWGMQARAAAAGGEALDWLRAGEVFDVAVLDMQMPGMDGAMLAAEIRRRRTPAELPIVLLSSLGRRDCVASPELFSTFLTKPVKPAQLFEALVDLFRVREARKAIAHRLPESVPGTRRAESVLVAEDNAVNLRVVLSMLAKLGYRADVAASGREVLEALGRQTYAIILMDVHMPDMDGLEATLAIRAGQVPGGPRPWIIALTANAMEGDRSVCLAAGMDDYISKPITIDELGAAMARASGNVSGAGGPGFPPSPGGG